MEWDDDILEEDHVLISQRDGESWDDTRKNVKKLGGTIEFMCFVDKTEEALIDSFSNHFTARYQLNKKFALINKLCFADLLTLHDIGTR